MESLYCGTDGVRTPVEQLGPAGEPGVALGRRGHKSNGGRTRNCIGLGAWREKGDIHDYGPNQSLHLTGAAVRRFVACSLSSGPGR
jgi:hypothetical protein